MKTGNIDRKALAADIGEAVLTAIEALMPRDTETEVPGADPVINTPYWLDIARKYEGLDEDDDKAALQELMNIDPEMTPWCAAFANAVLEEARINGTGSLRARDFANWGEECECKDGAVAVFKKHVGFVVKDGEKLLGGNQGNMVKESNLQWYHDNMQFMSYRWPKITV